MTIDYFKAFVIFCIGLLIAWGLAEICISEQLSLMLFVVVALDYMMASIGLSIKWSESSRALINIKVAVITSVLVITVMNFVYSFFEFGTVAFIIPNGILLFITILLVRIIAKSEM